MSACCKLDWVSIVYHERSTGWHTAKGLCSLAIFFFSPLQHTRTNSQQHPPISHSINQLLSHTIKAACPIIGSPPSTLSPFVWGRGGLALSRGATADNKSEWQAHSQRPPHTKAAAWWIIDIGNLTPTHPTPLYTSQMPMADQYQGTICNSLLADYLKGLCLQSGYQY